MSQSRVRNFQMMVRGRTLEVQQIQGTDSQAPQIVFLHEGLGSVSNWKDFPARVAAASRCSVTVYSRLGAGNSDPLDAPRPVTYMHDEALSTLPALLSKLEITDPVLVGHSDGASIALIYAGSHNGVRGLVVLAPHVFVEDLSVQSITDAKVKFQTTNLPEKLGRHHRDAGHTFWAWNDIWLHPDFRSWNIEEYLPRIACPALVIQGEDDQYGTIAQVEAIAKQSGGSVESLMLADCRHSPQRDQPEATLEAIRAFIARTRHQSEPA